MKTIFDCSVQTYSFSFVPGLMPIKEPDVEEPMGRYIIGCDNDVSLQTLS